MFFHRDKVGLFQKNMASKHMVGENEGQVPAAHMVPVQVYLLSFLIKLPADGTGKQWKMVFHSQGCI